MLFYFLSELNKFFSSIRFNKGLVLIKSEFEGIGGEPCSKVLR